MGELFRGLLRSGCSPSESVYTRSDGLLERNEVGTVRPCLGLNLHVTPILSTMMLRSSGRTVTLIKLSRLATSFSVTVSFLHSVPGYSLLTFGKAFKSLHSSTRVTG